MALTAIDLFGGGLGQTASSGSVLVEMKAGKCLIEGSRVLPDKRKGMLLIRQEDDGLRHLVWMCRENNTKEDDLIVVDDAYLERVPECTTGRVYVLRFTSSDKKMLFWMQSADESKDEALIKRFNGVAGGEPSSQQQLRSGPDGSRDSAQQQQQLTNLLLRFAQQLEQRNKATGDDFQGGSVGRTRSSGAVPISAILTSERLRALCDDPQAMEELKSLVPAAEDGDAEEEVRQSADCPQLAHAQHLITQAIYSEQLPLLMGLMELPQPTPAEVASAEDPMLLLLEGLEKKLRTNPGTSSSSGDGNLSEETGSAAGDSEPSASGDGGDGEKKE